MDDKNLNGGNKNMEPTEVVTKTEETPAAVVEGAPVASAPDLATAASELAKAAALTSQAAAAKAALAALTKPKAAVEAGAAPVSSTASDLKIALSAAALESVTSKPAATVKAKKAAPAVETSKEMTQAEAKSIIAKYEGKRGRRPEAFHLAQKLLGIEPGAATPKPPKPPKVAKVAKVKAAKVAKPPKAPKVEAEAKPMSHLAAKTYVASFEGKKGRRPVAFYEAQKLLGIEPGTKTVKVKAPKAAKVAKAPKAGAEEKKAAKVAAKAAKAEKKAAEKAAVLQAKADKKAAKAAKKTAKLEAIAAKKAVRAEKKAAKAKAIADKKAAKAAAKGTKAAPTTGQSGPPLKDLTAEDLNEKEVAVILVLGTEGHRTDKTIADMAAACFPNKKKVQANSWVRNGLRRLVRAKLLEKSGRGLFKQTLEGREVAKKVEALQKK